MGRLSKEQESQLADLLKLRDTEEPEDFEVDIADDKGNSARLPYSKARPWMQRTFGIDPDPDPEDAGGSDGGQAGRKASKPADDGRVRAFGRRVS